MSDLNEKIEGLKEQQEQAKKFFEIIRGMYGK